MYKLDEIVEKWEKTGLLHGLKNSAKTMAAVMMNTVVEELEIFPPKHKEISNMVVPVVRVLANTGYYPEPTNLYRDFCKWYDENRNTYRPNGMSYFDLDAELKAVNDYASVCKDRLK